MTREESLKIISKAISNKKCCDAVVDPDAGLSLGDFVAFLFSPILNNVLDTKRINEKSDMTHPLTRYLCFSSHNTYLAGH